MKKHYFIIGLLFFIYFTSYVSSSVYGQSIESIGRTYWDRAVEIAEKNRQWVPENIYETETVFDQQGNQVEINETHVRITGIQSARQDLVLISRKTNDEDITTEFQKEFNELKPEIIQKLREDGIFAKSTLPLITLTDLKIEENLAVYRFKLTVENEVFTGIAKIHIQSGCPLFLEIRAERLVEEDWELTRYVETTTFNDDPDQWYALKINETMNVKIKGFFSSFKGKIRTALTLEDYCKEY